MKKIYIFIVILITPVIIYFSVEFYKFKQCQYQSNKISVLAWRIHQSYESYVQEFNKQPKSFLDVKTKMIKFYPQMKNNINYGCFSINNVYMLFSKDSSYVSFWLSFKKQKSKNKIINLSKMTFFDWLQNKDILILEQTVYIN